MRKQNLRKARWDSERNRAYVLRDGVLYWAPDGTDIRKGDAVRVLNPDVRTITVKYGGLIVETWRADATSPGSGG